MTDRSPNPIPSPPPAFDARTVPVLGFDAHLPAVPVGQLTATALRTRFAAPPPWQAELHAEPAWSDRPPTDAAVLVGIVQRTEPTVLLTERTAHLSTHSGQIAFPGGRVDPGDRDAADAALREAWEEVGLERRHAEVLGALPRYTTGTGFAITPVVALLDPAMRLVPNPEEVADVFEVPLAFLMNPAHHRRHATTWQGVQRQWLSMPWNDSPVERFVWGATAGMLRNLYRFLAA